VHNVVVSQFIVVAKFNLSKMSYVLISIHFIMFGLLFRQSGVFRWALWQKMVYLNLAIMLGNDHFFFIVLLNFDLGKV